MLTLLTAAIGATSAVEVGTFTGYSALCIARGLAPGGRLLACDVSHEWTALGRKAWEAAGVADRIDLPESPALETLRSLPQEPTVDLAFIDADKPNYLAVQRAHCPGCGPAGSCCSTTCSVGRRRHRSRRRRRAHPGHPRLQRRRRRRSARIECVMLPVADGLTILRRLPWSGTTNRHPRRLGLLVPLMGRAPTGR
ncbi:MAG: class I SAM-dependent methyltransferase [Acidimicrobiales bacterium]